MCKLVPTYKITAPPALVVDVDQPTFPLSIPLFCRRSVRCQPPRRRAKKSPGFEPY